MFIKSIIKQRLELTTTEEGVIIMMHMDEEKNGGSKCNDCGRNECNAGIYKDKKGIRHIARNFKCPGHVITKKD